MLKFSLPFALAFAVPASASTYVFTAHVVPVVKYNPGNGGGSTNDVSDLSPIDLVITGDYFTFNSPLYSGDYRFYFVSANERSLSHVYFSNTSLGISGDSDRPPLRVIQEAGSFLNVYYGDFSLTVNGIPVALAVPEPSTWATMLIGFGLIGFAQRRRRREIGRRFRPSIL